MYFEYMVMIMLCYESLYHKHALSACQPVPTIVPWVHSPLSSHWTITADPMGIYENTGEASL